MREGSQEARAPPALADPRKSWDVSRKPEKLEVVGELPRFSLGKRG
jgi:hypothetical protein